MSSDASDNDDDEGSDQLSTDDDEDSSSLDEEEEEELSEADHDLFDAITRNDKVSVQQALRNGASLLRTRDYDTPLLLACQTGYTEITRTLLDAGADARYRIRHDWSPITIACRHGHLPIIEMLLTHDKDLLEMADSAGFTPLLAAIIFREFEVVHFLLDRGANVLATTGDGTTTLLLALQIEADLEIVRRLLDAGASVEARDEMQRTALHRAAKSGSIELVRELIDKHNANMFAVDEHGRAPFDSLRALRRLSKIKHFSLIDTETI